MTSQWFLFERYAIREVVSAYPTNQDQLTYLEDSYRIYEEMRQRGVVPAVARAVGLSSDPLASQPTGVVLQVQAALLYRLAGPSRLAAISVNFFYWTLFEVVLVATLRTRSGCWGGALLGLGLLTCTVGRFYPAGGLFDFRLDFAAECLFGVLLCTILLSSGFSRSRWSLAAGFVAGILVSLRFITIVYLTGIAAIVAIFLFAADAKARRSSSYSAGARSLWKFTAAMVIAIALAGPVLWLNRSALAAYYFVGHVTGHDKNIRAVVAGIDTLTKSFAFYPRSLIRDHLGETFVLLSLTLVACALARRAGKSPPSDTGETREARHSGVGVVLAASIFIPLIVLTLDVDKSHVVGGIMVPPVVLVLVMILVRLDQRSSGGGGGGRSHDRRGRFLPLAAAALVTGIAVQLVWFMRPGRLSAHRADVERLFNMYDAIGARCEQMGWSSPVIASDCIADYISTRLLNVRTYERNRRLLSASEVLARLQAYPPAEAYRRLERSDFAILTLRTGRRPSAEFPFNRQMAEMHSGVLDWCGRNRVQLGVWHVFNRDVFVFMRKPR